ncbi:PC-esterase domain-containing protein 1A [Ictalurus punctatus]|uniref:PC-esterase domain-containing protein 1A n=1 Tax=Ictalurus punctatus TaxID=7998 RepID=A0A2D0RCH5_ICTPU|nr:PC-esterase domain-containing protein 1A [Ictalurus punctatus]
MREACMRTVTHRQASQLLHNKFVVVLGDSIQRSVYKDLVLLLQRDSYLSLSQLKRKGELSFEQDCLIEGGRLGHMNNGTEYREVRQYRTDHHLVRFYFITRIFSRYMESILSDFKHELKPDVVIASSCVWDISRYNRKWVPEYKENLNKFFVQLKAVLPEDSLVVWNMTMPLGKKIIGGFLVPEIQDMAQTLRYDVIEANFYGAMLADAYGLDVLDLHFHFRFSLQHRMNDGVHWNAVAHRYITCLLLAHSAQAWGVELPNPLAPDQSKTWLLDYKQTPNQSDYSPARSMADSGHYGACEQQLQYDGFGPRYYEDALPTRSRFSTGYLNFENKTTHNGGSYDNRHGHGGNGRTMLPPAAPSCPGNNFVMKQKRTKRQSNPYSRHNSIRSYRY